MPTLRALECLVAVFDHGSVTAAAAALHLSQPALSHQLAQLEREIGTPLLERLPRGVRPTVAGRAVHADAAAALAAADRVLTTGRAVATGGGGVLRVACAETMTAGLLAPVLRASAGAAARTRVELTELTSADEIAARVADGAADVGVAPPGPAATASTPRSWAASRWSRCSPAATRSPGHRARSRSPRSATARWCTTTPATAWPAGSTPSPRPTASPSTR